MSAKRTPRPRRGSDPLDDALRALVAGLRASARPSMIIGGIAVIARGVPRLTRDIDATVAGGGTDLAWLPFELEAIAASDVVQIHGAKVPVARAEDLVIYKLAAWRPQDQQDVERLIALHGEHMDLARVRAAARDLAATLDEPQRMVEFERVLARAGAPPRGKAAASPPADAALAAQKPSPGKGASTSASTGKRKKPAARPAAQPAAAPDGVSNRATRGRTRRG